jgi:hypothetical protein
MDDNKKKYPVGLGKGQKITTIMLIALLMASPFIAHRLSKGNQEALNSMSQEQQHECFKGLSDDDKNVIQGMIDDRLAQGMEKKDNGLTDEQMAMIAAKIEAMIEDYMKQNGPLHSVAQSKINEYQQTGAVTAFTSPPATIAVPAVLTSSVNVNQPAAPVARTAAAVPATVSFAGVEHAGAIHYNTDRAVFIPNNAGTPGLELVDGETAWRALSPAETARRMEAYSTHVATSGLHSVNLGSLNLPNAVLGRTETASRDSSN